MGGHFPSVSQERRRGLRSQFRLRLKRRSKAMPSLRDSILFMPTPGFRHGAFIERASGAGTNVESRGIHWLKENQKTIRLGLRRMGSEIESASNRTAMKKPSGGQVAASVVLGSFLAICTFPFSRMFVKAIIWAVWRSNDAVVVNMLGGVISICLGIAAARSAVALVRDNGF